jgi:hypothetical protein
VKAEIPGIFVANGRLEFVAVSIFPWHGGPFCCHMRGTIFHSG